MARHLIQSATTGETRIVGDAALPFFPGYVIKDTLEDGQPPAVYYDGGESDLRYVNVSELSDPESAPSIALRAAFAPKADPAFTGTVGLPGGASGNPRLPVNGAVLIDGAVAKNYPGGGDKVGYSFATMIRGGFTGDTGSNPAFVWGANDFVTTGSTSGDVAGIANLAARETEVHLYTPGATISNAMKALQLNCKIEASATGSTVQSMIGLYISALSDDSTGSSVTNAYGLYVEAPTVAATNKYGLYVNGATYMVGPLTVAANSAATFTGPTAFTSTGSVSFAGSTPNAQGAAFGTYVGASGNPGIDMADGTNTVRMDNNAGTFRVLKAGVQSNFEIDLSGNTKLRGGPGFYNTTPVASKATVTGSRGANAALASLLTALAATGLIADGTTA